MAADQLTPLSLPDTQNADILTLTQSQDRDIYSQRTNVIWGRLYPNKNDFPKIEMDKNEYTLGRSERCDIVLTSNELKVKWLNVISKIHFRIIREYLNGNTDDYVVYLEDLSHNGTFVNRKIIGRGNRVILENNDAISLAQAGLSVYTFLSTMAFESSNLPSELKCKYAVSRTLGTGVCGEVKMIFSKIGCKRFALKSISKKGFLTGGAKNPLNDPDKIMNEVKILKALRHPCIIRMEEILDTPLTVYIVLELMEGGELFDRIRKRNGLSERVAKVIFYQVVLAVHYLHERGIAHRDLKPENILLASNAELPLVKVSDFGLSKLVDTESMMKTFCGTPMYVAPEVLLTHGKGTYTNQVDVWSLGVILYCCLSGLVPFNTRDKELSLQHQIIHGIYQFPRSRFSLVSHRALELIRHMMTPDPKKRITINQVLLHNWLCDREVEQIVNKLMKEENGMEENIQPALRPFRYERNIELPITSIKRARVE